MLKKWIIAAVFMAALFPGALAATKTINFELATGEPYFCNPCWITYSNGTGSGVARSALGASNLTFDGSSSEYTLLLSARLWGFNISAVDSLGAGATSMNFVVHEIKNQGKLAYVFDGSVDGRQVAMMRAYSVILGYNKNGRTSYSYQYLKNVSKAIGFESINVYNAGANYSISQTIASTAFDNYDVVAVTGHSAMSGSMSTALDSAQAKGVKIVIGGKALFDSGMHYQSAIHNSYAARSGLIYYGGTEYVAGNAYPAGEDIYTFSTYSTMYRDIGVSTPYSSGGLTKYVSLIGDNLGINYTEYDDYYPFLLITTSKKPLISKHYNYYIVPSVEGSGGYAALKHTPMLRALMYASLFDFAEDDTEKHALALNVYEGTEICGNVKPKSDVLCCYMSKCGMSTALTSETINYESRINALAASLPDQRDSTAMVMFYSSKFEHDQGWAQDYEDLYSYTYPDGQTWITYSDLGQGISRLAFAGIKGENTIAESHYYLNYDFYNTYVPIDKIDNGSIEIEAGFRGGQLSFDYIEWVLFLPIYHRLRTCEAGDDWELIVHAGYNESHYDRFNVSCANGNISESSAKTGVYDGDDLTGIAWRFGNAPGFVDYLEAEIGYNDTAPVKLIQKNEYGLSYNLARRFFIAKFSHDATNDDTGAYVEMTNTSMKYTYLKYSGGNLTLNVGEGTSLLTCFAPSGYAFYNPISDGYSALYEENISVFSDVSKGIQIQQVKPLTLKLKITSEDVDKIDNAVCSIPGYSDVISTGGYCVFRGISPNTMYNISVRTTGAERKQVFRRFMTGDYYDSYDADKNTITCGRFDGTYEYPIYIDRDSLRIDGVIKAYESGLLVPVGNVVVDIDGYADTTKAGGTFTIFVEYKTGNIPYSITAVKRPHILDFYDEFLLSEINCLKTDTCFIEVIVTANQSYGGTLNDDVIADMYDANDPASLIYAFMSLLTSPTFLGFATIFCVMVIGYSVMGIFGGILGLFGGTILAIMMGLIGMQMLLLIIIIGIIAVAVAAAGIFS